MLPPAPAGKRKHPVPSNPAEAILALCASKMAGGTKECPRKHVDELTELQSSLLNLAYLFRSIPEERHTSVICKMAGIAAEAALPY